MAAMDGDISLSQSLGGLRIANPDRDPASPSPPPTLDADPQLLRSHPSADASTADPHQRLQPPALPAAHDSAGSLGFNPQTFSTDVSHAAADGAAYAPRLAHRQSMPLAHQAQQQPYYHPPAPARGAAAPSPRDRPMSSIYNHQNLSTSSAAGQGMYRYKDDVLAADLRRANSSRVAATAMQGVPSREPSRSDRLRQAQLTAGNGPFPPRRSSRRVPDDRMSSSAPMSSQLAPYGADSAALPSNDDNDKVAAMAVRHEVDLNGRPVTRVIKKGVRDFTFGRTLGEGSYSTVLAATDRQTLREYAIKVLDKRHIIKEKKVKYVNIEKDTLNRLTEHPGIVRLYYTFQDDRSLYFVLDLATGGELLGFLKKSTTFDMECTRFYSAQILDAVDYMHSRGVIHRDLKPENVLLDDQMHVKITDFGTAKILDARSNGTAAMAGDPFDRVEPDRAQSFVGTAEYVSPELLTDKNACKASDLWAFGCIVYQLLAGRPPFKAANEYQTFQKIVGLEYSFPDGFPPVARDLVERLLVLDPAKRLPMEHIKNHPFFDGVHWGKGLWKQKAPRLKSYAPPHEPIRLNGGGLAAPSALASNTAPGPPPAPASARPQPRVITELAPPSQLDIEWSPVLTKRDERILMLGNMFTAHHPPNHPVGGDEATAETPRKFARFFGGTTVKRRQRLVMITSNARVLMCATGTNEKKLKEEFSLLSPGTSWKSFQDAKGLTAWCVDTRDKQFVFEDPKSTTSDPDGSKYSTQDWLQALEHARDIALSQSVANSADGPLNDLNSSISSPTSTLGGDTALEGVNIPTARHLRKDDEPAKGLKRFSKRHSKNGLANF